MTNIPKPPTMKEIQNLQNEICEKATEEYLDKQLMKKVDLTNWKNDPIPEDYLDKLMRDAYCPKCGKLMGDGEYGCMCEYSNLGETYCKKCDKQLFNNEKCDCQDKGSNKILRNIQRRFQCDKYCDKYLTNCVGALDECFDDNKIINYQSSEEAEQKERLTERFKNRKVTIPSADSDLIAENDVIDYEAMKEDEQKAYNLRVHRIATERERIKFPVENKWHDAKIELPVNDEAKLCFTTDAVMAYEIMRYEFDKQGKGYWKGSLINVTHYENGEHPYVIAWMDIPEGAEEI